MFRWLKIFMSSQSRGIYFREVFCLLPSIPFLPSFLPFSLFPCAAKRSPESTLGIYQISCSQSFSNMITENGHTDGRSPKTECLGC